MRRRRPAFLPAGSALARWLREGPVSTRPRGAALWVYRWKGFWFDANWRRQESLYPASAFEGEGGQRLVFVVGFWRSGTTLLHELLAAAPGMSAPRTFQCMNPSGFRIAATPDAGTAVSRPMDAVRVDAFSPQEDEFVLLARGAPSVYRAWLDPRRWCETVDALEQETWLALPEAKWLADWRTFLAWCMPATATHLVVKSPNHVFRLRAIHRRWPRARFVWTVRDPVDTWQSNRKMWGAMMAMYGLWGTDWEDLDRLLERAMLEYLAALRWAVGALDVRTVACLDFERLSCATAEVLAPLPERLGLGSWHAWRPLLEERMRKSVQHQREKYDGAPALPAGSELLVAQIREAHRELLGKLQVGKRGGS